MTGASGGAVLGPTALLQLLFQLAHTGLQVHDVAMKPRARGYMPLALPATEILARSSDCVAAVQRQNRGEGDA